ncbi:MAG: putative cysteine ligase BshC, partial [Bacteroidota bacterium]
MYFYKKNKMQNDWISYQESGYFSKLITAYLDQQSDVKSLYHRFPTLENFKAQLEEKAVTFNSNIRSVLVNELEKQYKETVTSTATANHISLLKETHTFTITTGHQLNLFTGPVYFIYKIVSTLNLCKQLQEKYPAYHFVPVYWMATEDHDFEEINHFKTQENSFTWQKQAAGAVGELSTEGLEEVADQFIASLNQSEAAVYLQKLFSQSYLSHNNLADATRFLV